MKKLLLIASLFLLAPLYAADVIPQTVGPFGTLNNRDSSYTLPADKASDLLNVEITEGGKSVKKRKGYGAAFTLSNATSAVHGTYIFYDANGNDVSLFFNDTRLNASVNGGTPVVLFSTGASGATYQCTDSLGFAYCANSARSALTKISATTSTFVTGFTSTGTMVAATPTRLAQAGFSDAPSRIDLSAETDFTNWTPGSLGSSPFQVTVNAPGARITHIVYAFGRLMWFKDTSFGYILIGNQPLQTDWVIKTVAYDIGTNDNTSVYREGILYFRGKDSHIYAFDGSNYTRLTKEISATINMSQTRASNSWTQTDAADFGAGTLAPALYADTSTVSGSLYLTFPDDFNSFRDGSSNSKQVWVSTFSGNAVGSVTVNSGILRLNTAGNTSGTGRNNIRTSTTTHDYRVGTTYYFTLSDINPTDAARGEVFYFTLSTNIANGNPDQNGSRFYVSFIATTTKGTSPAEYAYVGKINNQNDGDLCSTCSGDIQMPFVVQFYLSTTTYQLTVAGNTIASGTHNWPGALVPYVYMGFQNTNNQNAYAAIDNFGIAPEVLTYTSVVKNAPFLTSWDTFQDHEISIGNGTVETNYIRSSTNSIAQTSSTPTFANISNGQIPTVSTGTYFQFRMVFTLTNPLSTLGLSDFTQNWFEGNAADKAYATYFSDKIIWSITSGAGATTNNKLLLYDLLNQGWLLWDIPSNGFTVRQNKLYFGSPSAGIIYKYGDNDNDAGSAINAYWKSKDYFGDSPFTDKEYAYLSVVAGSVASSSMTVTYTLNGSSSTAIVMPLYSANSAFSKRNRNLPVGRVGNTFNVKFGNNAADQPFELFGLEYGIRPKPWTVTNP